ncbi:MAG: hypothetical protein LLF89_01935 [Spirochaetaceae bacterium]|nr:hypothetical protein [Spirochaetaceae bacterium]
MRRLGLGIFLFVAVTLLAVPMLQVHAQTKSTSITIVGVVPKVLRMSLDFSGDTTIQLSGYIPGNSGRAGAIAQNASYSSQPAATASRNLDFEIREGTRIDLGNARLFSNVRGSYSILVYSANRGKLQNSSSPQDGAVEFALALGDNCTTAQNGVFRFTSSGTSGSAGTPLGVALILGNVPASAKSGFYTDQLYFSISTN